jgi:ATP-binding protein involved in chromosome partitioning
MVDPRATVVEERLVGVERIIGVTGSKGGIGKSIVAATLALSLADRGTGVGLFDLDFTSPSAHTILGVERSFPSEEFGIDPHLAHGIHMMSVAFFAGDAPTPLRGADATSALLELLAITRWGELDVLLLDMPPGLGDTSLDVIRLLPRVEFLLVGTGSKIVVGSVRRAVHLLAELGVPMLGLLENLRREDGIAVADLAVEHGVPYLGALPFDAGLEAALGDVEALRATAVYAGLARLADRTGLSAR